MTPRTLDGTCADELWFLAPGRVEVRTAALADRVAEARTRGDGPLVIARAIASGVSQGTELLLYKGEGPEPFDPSLPAHAGTYPLRYGYCWVGEVVAADEGAGLARGTRVQAFAPHGSHHVARADAFHRLPDVPPARAVLAPNLETAVGVTWDATVVLGDDVLVIGAGDVGRLSAWLLRRSGARVTVVEPSDARRASARALDADLRVVESVEDAPGPYDRVVEASGRPALLDAAIARCRPGGRVVVASFYGTRRHPVDLGSAFHRRRVEIVASQVSGLRPDLAGRWTKARRFDLVGTLLAEPALATLEGTGVPLQEAPSLYARLADGEGPSVTCHFTYPKE